MRNTTKIASLADIQNIKHLLDISDKIKVRESKYEIVVFIKKRNMTDIELEAQDEIKRKLSDLVKED